MKYLMIITLISGSYLTHGQNNQINYNYNFDSRTISPNQAEVLKPVQVDYTFEAPKVPEKLPEPTVPKVEIDRPKQENTKQENTNQQKSNNGK